LRLFKQHQKNQWERIYQKHSLTGVGWYQSYAERFLKLIHNTTERINSNEFLYWETIKTGVMQFGIAPVFYIPKFVEILKDAFITELYMEPKKRQENLPMFSQ
jgi:hypothetical protein